MTMTITADAAVDLLVAEGYDRDDVLAAVDSLIEAGLETSREDENVLTAGEVDVLRRQLTTTLEALAAQVERIEASARAARGALYDAIREAVGGGMPKMEASRRTGVSRPTIDKILS